MSLARHDALYWRRRGLIYEQRYLDTDDRQEQERELIRYLDGLQFTSVLDVGCGFGRIGALLTQVRDVSYTGIDLSPQMLESARRKIPNGYFRKVSLEAFGPTHRYDLVLAVEVLMHINPTRIGEFVAKLRSLSRRHVVTVDWTEPLPDNAQDRHNWRHDYRKLFGADPVVQFGYQSLYHVGP